MKSILKIPAVNAVCISLFTVFYAIIFIVSSNNIDFDRVLYDSLQHYEITAQKTSFWLNWSSFLKDGFHSYIAYVLLALTAVIVIMLLTRRRPYDEYHVSKLLQCLTVALVLTLIAIAVFYVMVLREPNGIVEKFTLFIVIHWATVVLSDLVFVLVCRWN